MVELKMRCRECGKSVTIEVFEKDGYITLPEPDNGTVVVNKLSDNSVTLDFFCDDCSE